MPHVCHVFDRSKQGRKDHESIQSSTTPDPRYQWKSDKLTVRHHKREPRGEALSHQVITRHKLEDLKVLRHSSDLLNNVKIGQCQPQLIMEQILFYHIWGLQPFWSSDLNNLMNNPSNSPVISEKKMFRQVCGGPNEWPWIKVCRSA